MGAFRDGEEVANNRQRINSIPISQQKRKEMEEMIEWSKRKKRL